MRLLLTNLLLLGATLSIKAQTTESTPQSLQFPEEKFSVGMVMSDLFISRFSMEAEYKVTNGSAIALSIGTHLGSKDMASDFFFPERYPINDISTNLGYKVYLYNYKGHFLPFMRADFVYRNSDVLYYEKEWLPEVENGLTYLYYRDVQKYYHVESISLGMEMGFQLKAGPFFTDFSVGAQYRNVISNDTRPDIFPEIYHDAFLSLEYEGIVPRARIKLGFYFD